MKKILLLTTMVGLGMLCHAQHETLFNNARIVGAFGAPIVEMGLGNDLATSVGGGGALVFRNVFIGGYGMGSIDFGELIENEEVEEIDLGHGGFWIGYTPSPHRLLHLYTSARIGWGGVGVRLDDDPGFSDNFDNVFVMTPEAGIELNVASWLRVSGTVGYRFVEGVNENLGYYKDNDFNGAMANLTFRIGWFGWRRDN